MAWARMACICPLAQVPGQVPALALVWPGQEPGPGFYRGLGPGTNLALAQILALLLGYWLMAQLLGADIVSNGTDGVR